MLRPSKRIVDFKVIFLIAFAYDYNAKVEY